MKLNRGLVKRPCHFTEGNGSLLVVLDSSAAYWDWVIVEETVLVALNHFGMPYRLLDLATERLTMELAVSCAAIILAQNRLGERLTDAESQLLVESVDAGTGLVNFDNDLRYYAPAYLSIFSFDRVNPFPYATNLMRITEAPHYITQMQYPGEWHTFDRMVSAILVDDWGEQTVPLAEGVLGKDQLVYSRHLAPGGAFEPRNYPLLFAAKKGRGRAVQFTLNPRVWRNAFFGHARGIDDLFWRSIVWTAKKPFVANLIPPLVTMSFDDCNGRHGFAYADLAVQHGFCPMPSLLLKNVPESLFPKIRAGRDSGRLNFNTHALTYNDLHIYHFGRCECSEPEMKERFAFEDAWWKKVGTPPVRTNRYHWGEYGLRALPFLKQRGRLYFCPGLQMGIPKADMCMSDGYWPYNTQTCYYDYLPDDHDFFAFMSIGARHQEDFLTNCTANLRESEVNDVEKAAVNAEKMIRHGLRGGFFAELITHEQKFQVLSMEQWDKILARTLQRTADLEIIHIGHDEIGDYLKAKDAAWLSNISISGGRFTATLAGQTVTPLRLSVFSGDASEVGRQYLEVPMFNGSEKIEGKAGS